MASIMFHQRSPLQFPDTLCRCLKFPLQVEGFICLLAGNCWSWLQIKELSFGKPKTDKQKPPTKKLYVLLNWFYGWIFFLKIYFSYVNVMFCESITWLTHVEDAIMLKILYLHLGSESSPLQSVPLISVRFGSGRTDNSGLSPITLGSHSVPRLKPVSSKCWSLH